MLIKFDDGGKVMFLVGIQDVNVFEVASHETEQSCQSFAGIIGDGSVLKVVRHLEAVFSCNDFRHLITRFQLCDEHLTDTVVRCDGVIVARFYAEYVLSVAFENLAEQLGKSGVSVEIRTADPNISEVYLERLTCLPRGALTVRRVAVGELKEELRERSESRFFTLDRPRTLLGAWLAFRRYLRVRRAIDALAVMQTLLGGALVAALAFGFGSLLIPISLTALYHACALVLLASASLNFRNRISSEISDVKEPEHKETDF